MGIQFLALRIGTGHLSRKQNRRSSAVSAASGADGECGEDAEDTLGPGMTQVEADTTAGGTESSGVICSVYTIYDNYLLYILVIYVRCPCLCFFI